MEYIKKRRIYVDFDGVIKDTYEPLFEDYWKRRNNGEFIDDTEHVIKKDWIYVLDNSPVINDAIRILNEVENVFVCTRIHSLENEGVAKIRDMRKLGLQCDIILVPYQLKKTDVVDARGNILVDDAIFNLDEWAAKDGFPIFFDNLDSNVDGWGIENKKYVKTRTLDILKKY